MKTAGNRCIRASRSGRRAFTLAEVLAALVFMAIVIPVAVQGLRIASLAGEVAERKAGALRVAERMLNETLVVTNTIIANQSGTLQEQDRDYRWSIRAEPWVQSSTNRWVAGSFSHGPTLSGQPPLDQFAASQVNMNLVSVEVVYSVQERDYTVRLSTLVSNQR